MCGIVALLSKQEPISKETLKRATERLFHRGPDGQKYWISPNGRVGLGHARLSIIDLTAGDQPIANSEETLHIVVNGEFYDFERIRHDLEKRGCRFRTHSDSEIALHLYAEFGTQSLHYLRGEFAFVLWRDPINQSLYLWSKTILPNYILRMLGDGVEMAHSIKGRLPFLDHHLVELVSQLPVCLKINGMTEKYALREATRPYLTDTIYKRQKHPFLAPPSTLSINTPLQEMIQETLRSPLMGSVLFYDQSKVIALLDKLPEMDDKARTSIDSVLMKMLSVCVLQERFGLSV